MRRELEMPAAAMHHAGIHAAQLQELEQLLKEDVADETALWGNRVLLHRELAPLHGSTASTASRQPLTTPANARTSANGAPPPNSASASPAEGQSPEAAAAPSPQGLPATPGGGGAAGGKHDDVTHLVDLYPGSSVAPFWENVDTDSSTSLLTPLELMQQLADSGYRISYRRIPLSRERTPEAADVNALHLQLTDVTAAAAEADPECDVLHLILCRTPTGSSARFVAALLGTYLSRAQQQQGPGSGASSLVSRSSGMLSLDGAAGEYRGIMSLCRLMQGGFEAKLAVDAVIAAVGQKVGDLLVDIQNCKAQAEAPAAPTAAPIGGTGRGISGGGAVTVVAAPLGPQFAARQLGLHYLHRYFLLITYRCYLEQGAEKRTSFAHWVHEQPELHHLANHLRLDL
ncbi:hypothetical protein Vretimale_18744 [Volvox reticuliferus]|nr:hypothetical protein Vretimale_18744 [Volvox reticuliferus]